MFNMKLEWKESYNVDLPSFESWLRINYSSEYVGNSAGSSLRLYFSETLEQADQDAIQAEWDSLEEESEATKIQARLNRDAAVVEAKSGVLAKAWDDMSVAERKIVMSQDLNDSDRDSLLSDYPQGGE